MIAGRGPLRGVSVRTLIAGGAATLVTIMVVATAGLLLVTSRMRLALEREARTMLAEQQIVDRINRDVARQLLYAASYLDDPRPETLADFRDRGESVYTAVRRYLFRDLSLPQRLQVERVKELHQALEVRAQEAFDARRDSTPDVVRVRAAAVVAAGDPLQVALDRFLALRAADYDAALRRHGETLRRLYGAAALLAGLLFVSVLLALRFVQRRLLLPLDELSHAAQRLGAGDLAARVPLRHDDELARVGGSFNAMATSLGTLQHELRRSEDRYRRLVELSPDAVIVHADDRIQLVNDAARRQLGAASASQLVGRPLLDLVHPDAKPSAAERLRHVLAAEEPASAVELPFRRLDGQEVHGELAATAFEFEGRAATLMVVRDVTTRRKAEAALQAAEEQLRQAQKMEAVGRLAGGIAHDFNNLLTVIMSYAELLESAISAADPLRDDVAEIRAAARRASRLTGQLLAFSRKQVLRPRLTDLNAVVAEMVALLRRLIGADIDLRPELEPQLPAVEADTGQIEQVIVNLVVNARDAMPHGGRLHIRTRRVLLGADAIGDVPGARPGAYVVLSVTDTGTGMDRATQERVFEPFFTTKPTGKGTGLGLATVYGIVQQSGGHIRLRSELGLGTTLEIFLPQAANAELAAAIPEVAPGASGGSETVLLVEDDEAVRALARRILQRGGYTVIEAANGDQAIRLAAEHRGPLDLLLTDVVLPGIGGRELAARLEAARPGLPVLFTSGYTEDEVLRRGIHAHTERFVPKPYAPHELLAHVRGALDARRTSAS
ncbi:hybrid sensor histidine kinase/response regulator [Roseisolibacter agri]|uniref:histidine kinase n=1 Tax=Roseisolibacter agri TaxID=2014610 RepID=A0AA37Q779_9BACT|nr:response regulator [Roseisolibacter agri]GLC27830.1 hypothetical protein rosag_43430 [Roseisolibacter agri]